MQEKITVALPKGLLEIEANHAEDQQVLHQYLLANSQLLEPLLTSYYFTERKRVSDLRIDDASFSLQSGKGSFTVNYTLGLFNACADLDYNEQEKMKIEIVLDMEVGEALLTGEYFPEREPDEF
jgi:hypothetical protein